MSYIRTRRVFALGVSANPFALDLFFLLVIEGKGDKIKQGLHGQLRLHLHCKDV